jgi:hypothetical protein
MGVALDKDLASTVEPRTLTAPSLNAYAPAIVARERRDRLQRQQRLVETSHSRRRSARAVAVCRGGQAESDCFEASARSSPAARVRPQLHGHECLR